MNVVPIFDEAAHISIALAPPLDKQGGFIVVRQIRYVVALGRSLQILGKSAEAQLRTLAQVRALKLVWEV